MKDPQFPELLNLLLEIRNLKVDKVKISLGRLQNLMSSACVEHLDFSGSFNINELEIEPFAQIQHSLYENQNFSEMAPPKIMPEDVNDYTVSLNNALCGKTRNLLKLEKISPENNSYEITNLIECTVWKSTKKRDHAQKFP